MAKVHETALTVERGEDQLAAHEWNTHRAKHFFCSRCGSCTFHRKRAAPDYFGVNVFCLEDFDPAAEPMYATDACPWSIPTRGADGGDRARSPSASDSRRRTHKQKRRLPKEAAFWIRTSKEENFLSLAGLAATYSPRA